MDPIHIFRYIPSSTELYLIQDVTRKFHLNLNWHNCYNEVLILRVNLDTHRVVDFEQIPPNIIWKEKYTDQEEFIIENEKYHSWTAKWSEY